MLPLLDSRACSSPASLEAEGVVFCREPDPPGLLTTTTPCRRARAGGASRSCCCCPVEHGAGLNLQALGLSSTQLTDVAAEAFSRALMDGKSAAGAGGGGREAGGGGGVRDPGLIVPCPLRRLDLSRNSITNKGAG